MLNALFDALPRNYTMSLSSTYYQRSPLRFSLVALVSCLLWACEPANERTETAQQALVNTIDMSLLPNQQWAFADGVLQISFCRDRINDALMAEAEELRTWRAIGEVTAFPARRHEGLALLAEFHQQYEVLLWQQSGTVSSQFYRLVVPQGQQRSASIFNALASVGRDRRICFSAVDQGGSN
jgi:hypothetical protein